MAVISLSGFSVYLKMHLDQLFYCYEDEGKRSHWQVPLTMLIFYTMNYQMHVGKQ